MAKASKKEEPSEPVRSLQDTWREEIGHSISACVTDLEARRSELSDMKQELRDLKSAVDDKAGECSDLETQIRQYAMDMKRVEDGNYSPQAKQQSLPFASSGRTGKSAHDGPVKTRADVTPLERLLEYGLPKGLMSALQSSQLASERKLDTVGDLLKAIQADDGWYLKVKGMGEERRTKLIDAISEWAVNNHEPVESDGRVRQCNDVDCHQHASRGIYVEGVGRPDGGQCPNCGKHQFWTLIDP